MTQPQHLDHGEGRGGLTDQEVFEAINKRIGVLVERGDTSSLEFQSLMEARREIWQRISAAGPSMTVSDVANLANDLEHSYLARQCLD